MDNKELNLSFLSSLRRNGRSRSNFPGEKDKFFFMINFDGEDNPFISIVNKKGEEYMPQGGADNPAVAGVLSLFKSSDIDSLGWVSKRTKLWFGDNPHLSYMLMQCDNVVNTKMERITYDPTIVTLNLDLKEENGKIYPSLFVEDENGVRRPFAFLTDSLVIAGDRMSPCLSVGENYRHAKSLLTPFESVVLEPYLSIVLSALSHIHVVYGDRRVLENKGSGETPLPGLLFEKVDFDKALFVKVLPVIPGISIELTADFDINTVVNVTDDTLIIRHVNPMSVEELRKHFECLLDETFKTKKDRASIYRDGALYIFPQKQAASFLMKMLPRLVREYSIFGAEKLREFKIVAASPRLNVKLSSGIDFLEGEATVELGDETFTLADLLNKYRHNKYVELSNGERVIIEDNFIRRLERIFRPLDDPENPARIEVSFFDIPGLEQLMNNEDLPQFAHSRKFYNGLMALPKMPYNPPPIHGDLRPYQCEGIKWMQYLSDNGFGACLADDMGLGKTIQTIALLMRALEENPAARILIVMPKSLLFNWKSELQRFSPEISSFVYHGLSRDFGEALKSQVILTTYSMVRNDLKLFVDIDFDYVILDESQNIKNITAQTTRAVMSLKACHRIALSGTPMENNLQELYSLFRFLNPAMFGALEEFNARYTVPIHRDNDKETMEALRRKIFPFILRRLKKDVLQDLPDRVDRTLYVEMEPEHRKLYERRRMYYKELIDETINKEGIHRSQFVMFQALSELRRIASVPESLSDGVIRSPKLEMLSEQVQDAVSNGHKVVVFFNFIAGLELAAEELAAAGIGIETMTGATNNKARESIVRKFQTDPTCQVLLMTMKVGGVGLNLTAADMVYIFEPWWNKAAEEQAVSRLHRIGQKSTVFTFSMITHDTIEDKIRELQEKKVELFNELISSDSTMSKSLSREDIDFILS